ncbi:hypothetical protein [Pontiella agarivorans]|uniref:SLA1 homology domain-containing protein n=1 Tax=Pontiella agarivorans TaxID=3038953 RepID=A0ABU5N235_9BACT|nr:hypothetical protein [Pontiella agarivorans]MDZ8120510.1 hypothetical protein [Pontiella agarivorans]
MKKKMRSKKVNKGAPSGFIISIAIHAAAFALAGMLVVFNVVQKEEKKFVPPKPVDRPKMKLKKPKVKVKKSVKPRSTTRIVTKVQRASMPDIQLPEMSGMADGLIGDVGGFDLGSLDVAPSVLGDDVSAGNDLVGTFYTIMRDRTGRPITYSGDILKDLVHRFYKSGWKTSTLSRYYRSPKKLYGSMVVVPEMFSNVAPLSFGESDRDSQYWIVHYKGQIVYPEDITFRFVCQADMTIGVKVDNEMVLGGWWKGTEEEYMGDVWRSSSADNRKWWMGNWTAVVGDWVTLKANEPQDIEILISDAGGLCCLMLAIQEEGVDYETRPGGGPRLPAFKTAYPSHDLQDMIMRDMVPGEISLTNGPVFNDFASNASEQNEASPLSDDSTVEMVSAETVEPAIPEKISKLRSWSTSGGGVLEAEYVTRMGDKVVLKDAKGKQRKIALSMLSAEDLNYIELCNPPDLQVSVSNKEDPVFAYSDGVKDEVVGYDAVYTGKIRKKSPKAYPHELTAEFYAIGVQNYADTYLLLDRQESTFVLDENQKEYNFSGNTVHLRKIEPREWESADFTVRGEKDYGYLIVVKDKRGEIIAKKATAGWIEDAYEKLKDFPVGRYLNEQGERVFPEGPPRARY